MENSEKYDVFISFKANENNQPTRDAQIAREIKEFLENYGVRTFYSDQDVRDSNYSDSIDRALEDARLLFLIGTKKEYLESKWIKEEHNRFFNLKLNPQRFIITESTIRLPTYLITVQFYKFNDPGFYDVIRELCKNVGIQFNDDKYLKNLSSGEGFEIMKKFDDLESTSKMLKPSEYRKIKTDFVETLHRIVENKVKVEVLNRDIISSISQAKRIQEALFPSTDKLDEILNRKNYFLFHEPKNMVSGDFFWIDRKDSRIMVVVADCSGYGVPGAIVSAMAIPLLHNIIIGKSITDTAQVLENLRRDFIEILVLKDLSVTKVYVDIMVISIHLDEKIVEYSGSFSPPMYMYRKLIIPSEGINDKYRNVQTEVKENVEILSVGSDNFLIGYSAGSMPFSKTRLKYKGGEMLYLSTDGYTDQVGGDFGQKLLAKKYRGMLLKTWDKSMQEQKENARKVHLDWKGKREQSDDILLLGLRLD
jgi:serine phosphatase RsbU (regulator of sigma subunit)